MIDGVPAASLITQRVPQSGRRRLDGARHRYAGWSRDKLSNVLDLCLATLAHDLLEYANQGPPVDASRSRQSHFGPIRGTGFTANSVEGARSPISGVCVAQPFRASVSDPDTLRTAMATAFF
jgi:hypothetical protein